MNLHTLKWFYRLFLAPEKSCMQFVKLSPMMSLSGWVALWVIVGTSLWNRRGSELNNLFSNHPQSQCSGSVMTAFQNRLPTLPTMPLGDMTGSNLSDYMQLPLEPQKASCFMFHICRSAPQDLYAPRFSAKIWWNYPLMLILQEKLECFFSSFFKDVSNVY